MDRFEQHFNRAFQILIADERNNPAHIVSNDSILPQTIESHNESSKREIKFSSCFVDIQN